MDPVERLLLDEAGPAERVLLVDVGADCEAAARDRFAEVETFRDRRDVCSGRSSVAPGDAALGDPALRTSRVDAVLARLPGGLTALDDLAERAARLAPRLVVAGRTKHLAPTMNATLARSFGAVRASLGRDKCRALIAAEPLPAGALRWPRERVEPTTGLRLVSRGAAFAAGRLDAGTRLLLTTSDRWPAGDAVDLGCGTGMLAAALARRGCRVTAIDVSRAAVDSTRRTLTANGLDGDVRWDDGLAGLRAASADLVVTNPPFHVGAAKDSSPTLAMLADAHRVLRPGGELWCVYNSHLPYLQAVRRWGRAEVVVRDRAYTVLRAVRPSGAEGSRLG